LMRTYRCLTCLSEFEADELPRRGSVCFKCHVKTIRLGFTYGQEDFHGPTIAERQRKTVEDARINGVTAEPVTNWM
jgi:DNA-directed RNA polymerase subunit RPC12/RpoP